MKHTARIVGSVLCVACASGIAGLITLQPGQSVDASVAASLRGGDTLACSKTAPITCGSQGSYCGEKAAFHLSSTGISSRLSSNNVQCGGEAGCSLYAANRFNCVQPFPE